ncbi:hypothetical protein MO867_21700 [Microbulbifer sp. OS29]|uniref:Uncharacterized protein n=1 Tax=Microbulbifer okhotskensis TaxID=2926617 RepID=A0A9X2J9T0_9GAMM|nr:hypothetical protein [Microbulbifer okhotskensis]MCO1336946.1 hypothetical protein [Microbulbifer okhotskensis]
MTNKETRARNIRLLREQHGPKNKDFAEALGLSVSYASQISQDPPITNVGDNKARWIEERLGLEPGWLDMEHPEAETRQQLKPGQIDEVLAAKCVAAMMETLEKEGIKMPSPRIFSAALITLYSTSQASGKVIDPTPILRLAILAGAGN